MNQRGDVSLVAVSLLFAMTGLLTLASVELQRSFRLLERRTELFLCVRELNGELNELLRVSGQANWGIRNAQRASVLAIFIPGLQGAAAGAEKVKSLLQQFQNAKIALYLKHILHLQRRGCPLDPRMLGTPFGLNRDHEGALRLKERTWTYRYFSSPYLLSVESKARNWEAINPKLEYQSTEKRARSP